MDSDVYIRSHELAWNAGWQAALDSGREIMDNDCKHGHYSKPYVQTPVEGGGTKWFSSTSADKLVFKKYISFFCPDCGIRIPEDN